MKKHLDHNEIDRRAAKIATHIKRTMKTKRYRLKCYPVPRGGIPAAYAVGRHIDLIIVNQFEDADLVIDDIVDSGKTRHDHWVMNKEIPFFALVDKIEENINDWIVFPWEGTVKGSADDIVTRFLQFIGEDPKREGLKETPSRFIRAWEKWSEGYNQDPADILKCFSDGGENYDQMILVKDIPFYSHCEHHITPIFGTATIAYIPDGKIVGLSKLSRLLDVFARRLQVQERLTDQVTAALEQYLKPKGSACLIKARHLCMESRGIQKQGHVTITSSLKGVFLKKPEAREEFMALAK